MREEACAGAVDIMHVFPPLVDSGCHVLDCEEREVIQVSSLHEEGDAACAYVVDGSQGVACVGYDGPVAGCILCFLVGLRVRRCVVCEGGESLDAFPTVCVMLAFECCPITHQALSLACVESKRRWLSSAR